MEESLGGYVKKYFLKNNYVLVFNILALISIFLGILTSFNYSFLSFLTSIFSSFIWIFLGIMLILSGVLAFYEKRRLMFLPLLFWLLFTTALIRTSNIDSLKDVTTNDWTLGPDLDPFLFLRKAIEIDSGNYTNIDNMRYAPIGTDNGYIYGNLMSWSIYLVYKIINLFGNYSITYGAIITPVIFFIISAIGFFLFVYNLSTFKYSKESSGIISIIATLLYSLAPQLLHRTIAGIPELESLGLMFFWFAFLFFVLAWKQETTRNRIVLGLISGIFTGAMSWTWGGYRYIYMTLTLSVLLIFLFEKEVKKNFTIFFSFLFSGITLEFLRTGVKAALFSVSDSGFALGVLFLMIVYLIISKKEISEKLRLNKFNIPKSIKAILISVIIVLVGILLINPQFLFDNLSNILERLLYPFGRGRVGLTVAENKTPYFVEIFESFGYLFWMFFVSLIFLFFDATKHFNLKKKFTLNIFFILFITTFIFSRISSESLLNGENFISRLLYFGGLIVFGIIILSIFIKSYLKNDNKTLEDFKKINFIYFLLISFCFWAIVSMRGAVRLFFIIAPILIIIASYLPIKIFELIKTKDVSIKSILIAMFCLVLIIFGQVAYVYTSSTVYSAREIAPSIYNQQWQQAMAWVRNETPSESIFVHWWDYGYWVQSIGKRPTVSDGGHYTTWWDHTVARYLLTTPNPDSALSLMKSHNVSYLLIDSTDIGKYGAYSSIGSDASGEDRLSWIPILYSDASNIQETKNSTIRIYSGNFGLDQDIIYKNTETEIYLPKEKSIGLGAIVEILQNNEGKTLFKQPEMVYYYHGNQIKIPIKYLYINGQFVKYEKGIDVVLRITPRIYTDSNGNSRLDILGSAMYLTEKVFPSLMAQLYLLDDPLNEYPTLKVAHSEDDYFVKILKEQGTFTDSFLLYGNSIRGPIKIWEVKIPEYIQSNETFTILSPEGWTQENGPWAILDNAKFRK